MSAIVFDLDGTLIDSAPDLGAAVNRMLATEGLAPLDQPTIISFIGNGLPRLVELSMETSGLDMGRHTELTDIVLRDYTANSGVLTVLYPGVKDVLQGLQDAGHVLGLCTNKPVEPTLDILGHFDLTPLFSAVIGGDSLPQRKPHPAPLTATFEALGQTGLYVGDSEVDAETAQRAGMPFALFTEGYRKSPVTDLPHDWAFDRFAKLPGIVSTANRPAK
jgi:phosphoglycolate phosphatase